MVRNVTIKGAIITVAIGLGLLTSGYAYISHDVENHKYQIRYDYEIKQGDTLWDLAEKNAGDEDVREWIFNVQQLNDVDLTKIRQGQSITIYRY